MNKFEQIEEQKVKGTSDFNKLLEMELKKETNSIVTPETSGNKQKTFLKKGEKSLNYKNRFVKPETKKIEDKKQIINNNKPKNSPIKSKQTLNNNKKTNNTSNNLVSASIDNLFDLDTNVNENYHNKPVNN